MRTIVVWGSAVGLLWLVCSGCSTQQTLIRGQSPSGSQSAIERAFAAYRTPEQAPIQQVNYSAPVVHGGYVDGGYCPPTHHHGQPHCHGCCPHGVLSHLCAICGWLHGWPWHHTTQSFSHRYNDPHAFVYPPPNQPPAVVQYPYYTVRGPSDFFMP